MCYLTYVADMNRIELNFKPAEHTCPSLWMKIIVGASYAL